MKKQIIVGNTTYTIEVKLNFRIDKTLTEETQEQKQLIKLGYK